jgi:hypothetical protein
MKLEDHLLAGLEPLSEVANPDTGEGFEEDP